MSLRHTAYHCRHLGQSELIKVCFHFFCWGELKQNDETVSPYALRNTSRLSPAPSWRIRRPRRSAASSVQPPCLEAATGPETRGRVSTGTLHRHWGFTVCYCLLPSTSGVLDVQLCVKCFSLPPPGGRMRVSPVFVLQQQLVKLLRLCTAVQVVGLLQHILCTGAKIKTGIFI